MLFGVVDEFFEDFLLGIRDVFAVVEFGQEEVRDSFFDDVFFGDRGEFEADDGFLGALVRVHLVSFDVFEVLVIFLGEVVSVVPVAVFVKFEVEVFFEVLFEASRRVVVQVFESVEDGSGSFCFRCVSAVFAEVLAVEDFVNELVDVVLFEGMGVIGCREVENLVFILPGDDLGHSMFFLFCWFS